MEKKILASCIFAVVMLISVIGVQAATLTKSINITCAYGTAGEKVTADISLGNINSPKFTYSGMTGTGKTIGSMYYSWSGFSNTYTKSISGDSASYKVTGTSKWRDSNYKEYGAAQTVYFYYKGSLS